MNLSVCYPCPDCTAGKGEANNASESAVVKNKKPARPLPGFSRVSKRPPSRTLDKAKVAHKKSEGQEIIARLFLLVELRMATRLGKLFPEKS